MNLFQSISIYFNMLLRISMYFYIFLCISVSSFSQDSLSNYLKIAAENNPRLKTEFLKYSASLEKIIPAGSLPDPQLELGFYLKPMELVAGNQIADIKIMQMFPWFGTLKSAKDEASKMAISNFENFINYRNELFYNTKVIYYNLFQIKKDIEITGKNLKILKTIEQIVLIKYKSNSGNSSAATGASMGTGSNNQTSGNSSMGSMGNQSQSGNANSSSASSSSSMSSAGSSMSSGGQNQMVNLFRIQIEINLLENNLALLNDKLKTEKVSFNRYLNRLPETEVFIQDTILEDELPININSLVDSIANNPMVKMYLADSAAYNARAKMLKKMSYPMIGLGVNYSVINKSSSSTSMMNGKDMIMPMLAVTLPIYRKKYNSMIHEAELLRDASAKLSQSVINDLRSEFQQTIQNYNDANRRITLYAKQSDLAENSLNILITSFSANGTDFEEILRMENQFLDYELKKIQAITDKNSLIAQFLYLTGFNF